MTSDSLAAESLKDDGEFGKGNSKAAASKQPSASTTTNTTDTSNATKLDPASNAQARESQSGQGQENPVTSAKGLGKESGVGPTYNTTGTSVNSSGDTRGVSTGTFGGRDNVQGNVAPTAAFAGQDLEAGVYKPKGSNLTEDNELKGKTKFGEIGTEDDPGRAAELKFAKTSAAVGGVSDRDIAQGGDSKFSGLKDEGA